MCRGRRGRCAGRARCRSTGSTRPAPSPMRAAGRSPPSCTIGPSSAPSRFACPTPTGTATAACSSARGEGDRLAANSDDSLSRLDQRTCHHRRRPTTSSSPAPTRPASSRIASGDADMAMIDALTLAHLRRSRPELTADLVELDQGAVDPQSGDRGAGDDAAARIDDLRDAFADALADDRRRRATRCYSTASCPSTAPTTQPSSSSSVDLGADRLGIRDGSRQRRIAPRMRTPWPSSSP